MLLNKVMGNFSACGSQAEPQLGSEMSPLTWMEKEKQKKQEQQPKTHIIYIMCLSWMCGLFQLT